MINQLESFNHLHTFILDVDGVLTDSSVLVTEEGELLRQMNVRDGLAIKMAVQKGFQVIIITGGSSQGVISRLKGLGVSDIYYGVHDKLAVYEQVLERYNLSEDGILYMGDDLPDYPVMRRVGLPTCPANAAPEVKSIARYISPIDGGSGCVRDVIERTMKSQGKWSF